MGACNTEEPVPPDPLRADGECRPAQRTDTLPQFCGRAPRNLVFVSIDTLRRDLFDPYSGETLMPFVADRAAEGFTLDDHL